MQAARAVGGRRGEASGSRFDILELPALLVVLLAVAARSVLTEDLAFWDEAAYLRRGLDALAGQWPRFSDGATYSDYYLVLSRFAHDPVGLYFAGRAGAAVLLVSGIWLAARLVVHRHLAWAAAAAIATTPAPYIWPGVAAPAAGVIVVGLAVLFRYPGLTSLGIAAGLFWLAAGSRPEFSWFALLCSSLSIAWCVLVVVRRTSDRPLGVRAVVAVLVGAVAVPVGLVLLHGSPFEATGRDWVAFGQHFSLRNAQGSEDPWLDWVAIVDRSFPGATSVRETLFVDPLAVLSHVVANLTDAPMALFRDALGVSSESLSGSSVGVLMLMSLLAGLALSLGVSPRSTVARLRVVTQTLKSHRYLPAWVVLGTLIISIALPVAIVYPRAHYLVIPAGLLVIGIVAVQQWIGSSRFTLAVPVAITVALFSLFALQDVRLAIARAAFPAPLAVTATRLDEADADWRLLAVDRGLATFVPGLTEVEGDTPRPGEDFPAYLDRNRINAVLINDRFMNAVWSRTPGFALFTADPTAAGFAPVSPGSSVWVRTPQPD